MPGLQEVVAACCLIPSLASIELFLIRHSVNDSISFFFRQRDIRDIDPSYALRTLVAMKTLNMSESSGESVKSMICCPVRNEQSEDVIGESVSNVSDHDHSRLQSGFIHA